MAPTTEQMLEALRQDNARLRRVEAELARAMDSLRGSEERPVGCEHEEHAGHQQHLFHRGGDRETLRCDGRGRLGRDRKHHPALQPPHLKGR